MESIGSITVLCLALIVVCYSYNLGDRYGPFEPCFNLLEVCKGHKKINAARLTAFFNPGVWNSANVTVITFHDIINPIQQIRVFKWDSNKRKFTHLVNFLAKDMCIGSVFTRVLFDKFFTFQRVGRDCFAKKTNYSVPHLDLGKVAKDILGGKFFYGKLKAEVLMFTAKENILCVTLEAFSQKDPCPMIV